MKEKNNFFLIKYFLSYLIWCDNSNRQILIRGHKNQVILWVNYLGSLWGIKRQFCDADKIYLLVLKMVSCVKRTILESPKVIYGCCKYPLIGQTETRHPRPGFVLSMKRGHCAT